MNPTAPGVYIRELDSGNRTIVGVATSITAFVGRAAQGPTDRPVLINNYGDYQRVFGGLDRQSAMSYSVRQFFLNGGSQAVIVRLVREAGAAGELVLPNGNNDAGTLVETVPGSGGGRLRLGVVQNAGRDLTIEEIASDANGQDMIVRSQTFHANDTAQLNTRLGSNADMLRRAIDANDDPIEFTSLPDEGTYEFEGTSGAHIAHGDLPNSADIFELTANDTGEEGNNFAASVYHSSTSAGVFSLVIEQRQADLSYQELGRFEGTNLADIQADLAAANLGLTVADPSGLPAVPNPVRRVHLGGGDGATEANLALGVGGLRVHAANEGAWGNHLRLTVDHDTRDPTDNSLFNLTVEWLADDGEPAATEVHRNVSTNQDHARRLDNVLSQQSNLIRWIGAFPSDRPAATAVPIAMVGGADGPELTAAEYDGNVGNKQGIFRLEDADLFNILVIPPMANDPADPASDVPIATWELALTYCRERRAMLMIDPPNTWHDITDVIDNVGDYDGLRDRNSAMYFPRMRSEDPLRDNILEPFTTSGAMAGLLARTDGQSGVWTSAAGTNATIVGAREFTYPLTQAEVGQLNPIAINCLQMRPGSGRVSWGARTLDGADARGSEWKYLAARRLTLFIEETLYRATEWAVFMNNDANLWQALRVSINTFMEGLYDRGAFFGTTKNEAFVVKCDEETTTDADVARGVVNVEVSFRPVFPAEFVVITIRQLARQ